MTESNREERPVPEPLQGTDPGSFAEYTVKVRLPNILREVIAVNNFPPQVLAGLEALLEEIPLAQVRPLNDPGAPDLRDWDRYVDSVAGSTWLQVPWFFAETYFYRRILEASGFFQPGPNQGKDPYLFQKRRVLQQGMASVGTLTNQLEELLVRAQIGQASKWEGLRHLVLLNLWGNQADLSMWSVEDKDRPAHTELEQQEAHLLVDDSRAVVDWLAAFTRQPRVDFILDNAGPELLHDLVMADFLLSAEIAGSVHFHLKSHPTFVSDAMIMDVLETVRTLASQPDPSTQALARRFESHKSKEKLHLQEDFFWNSPLPGWELPVHIRQELGLSDLLVSKGDANYRRLLGDRHWPPETHLGDVVRYLPAPVLVLRVAKAEIAVGLQPGQAAVLDRIDPSWRIDGNWGMIQFAR
jgi:uncharacterized protein with ATP-grasp and redox domains